MNASRGQLVFAKQLATTAEALANDALVIYPVRIARPNHVLG